MRSRRRARPELIARIAIAAALLLLALWLLLAASGGRTAANAGDAQFDGGPVCVTHAKNPPASGCPAHPR